MIIEKAAVLDAEEIAGLYNKLREYELSLLNARTRKIQLDWERKKTAGTIRGWLRSRNKTIFAAEEAGKTVGFVTGEVSKGIKYKEGAFDIYIEREFRNDGIGKKLMVAIMNWFKASGCRTAMLNIYSANEKAKQFYKKLGFWLVSETYKKVL